jgi:hypothetical protein
VTKDGKKTLKNIERSIKRENPKSRILAGTWNDFQKTFSAGEKRLVIRASIGMKIPIKNGEYLHSNYNKYP